MAFILGIIPGIGFRAAGLGGHVDIAFDNVGSSANKVKGGELRVLVVMDESLCYS